MAKTATVSPFRAATVSLCWALLSLCVVVCQTGIMPWASPSLAFAQEPSSYEIVGTLKKTGANHSLGQEFVLVNQRGQIAYLVEQVPGLDLARYLNQEVSIHGSQKAGSGRNGTRWLHPWRIDAMPQTRRTADGRIIAGNSVIAHSPSANHTTAGPHLAPVAANRLETTPASFFQDPVAPVAGNVALAAHAETLPSGAATTTRTTVVPVQPGPTGETWAISPPQPLHGEIIIPDGDWQGGNYGWEGGGCSGGMGCGTTQNRGNSDSQFLAGFDATFLQPRFSSNPAFTITESDGVAFDSITQRDFGYDLQFAPRIWAAYTASDGGGLRAQYWQLDHSAPGESASPPANGFGSIALPVFAGIGLTTTIPSDVVAASSSVNAYVIDLEATQRLTMKNWRADFTYGVRYGSVEQTYGATVRDGGGTLINQIDFSHQFQGAGPTVSLFVSRQVVGTLEVFGMARGSLLFGEGKSNLRIGEDLDLQNPFTTTQVTKSDDLLPIGELQVGLSYTCDRWEIFHPFLRAALEGQVWHGAGSATSLDGDLGFIGFTAGAGVNF